VVEFILFGSLHSLVHLPRKPFHGHPHYASLLDRHPSEKSASPVYFSVRDRIAGCVRPKISYPAAEALSLSRNGFKALQRPGRNIGPEFSKQSCRFLIHDGDVSCPMVSAIPDHLFHPCCLDRMESGLSMRSLSDGCRCRRASGLRDNENFSPLLFAIPGRSEAGERKMKFQKLTTEPFKACPCTETKEDMEALISAVGWCSGWEIFLTTFARRNTWPCDEYCSVSSI